MFMPAILRCVLILLLATTGVLADNLPAEKQVAQIPADDLPALRVAVRQQIGIVQDAITKAQGSSGSTLPESLLMRRKLLKYLELV
jgi:hypothetical protein